MASTRISLHDPKPQPSDGLVIRAVREGDVEAFAVLVDRYHSHVMGHLIVRVQDPDIAADLSQEAFFEAFCHVDRFDCRRPFGRWILGIADNRLLSHWRRQRSRPAIFLDRLLAADVNGFVPADLRCADISTAWNEQDALESAFSRLTPALRDALLLHGIGEFTACEVARALKITPVAAERRISRAKIHFRRYFDDPSDSQSAPQT